MAMFGKEGPARPESRAANSAEAALSIIAGGMKIVGDVESSGILKVDGTIDGSVTGARQVLLGRGGAIHGNVTAGEVVVGGVVDGAVRASGRLELQESAVVNGDIETKSIIVLEGARINGTVRMSDLPGAKVETRGANLVTAEAKDKTLRIATGA